MGHSFDSYDINHKTDVYTYRTPCWRKIFPCSTECCKIRCNWFCCAMTCISCIVFWVIIALIILVILGGGAIYIVNHPCDYVECSNSLCSPILVNYDLCNEVTCFGSTCVNQFNASNTPTPSLTASLTPSNTPSLTPSLTPSNTISLTPSPIISY